MINKIIPKSFSWFKEIEINNISYSEFSNTLTIYGELKVDEEWGAKHWRQYYEYKDFPSNSGWEEEDPVRLGDIIGKGELTLDGGIFPFVISKKDYMIVGGFDTIYQSPFICDWDFFLKLDLNGIQFYRINHLHFYHFGSAATKNGKEGDKFKATEHPAAQTFYILLVVLIL